MGIYKQVVTLGEDEASYEDYLAYGFVKVGNNIINIRGMGISTWIDGYYNYGTNEEPDWQYEIRRDSWVPISADG